MEWIDIVGLVLLGIVAVLFVEDIVVSNKKNGK
jgi:hypothetical protein